MSIIWKAAAWFCGALWAAFWGAVIYASQVDPDVAFLNLHKWLAKVEVFLGPNGGLWIKVIAAVMLAIPIVLGVWWLMGWRERMKEERKQKAASIPEALKPQPDKRLPQVVLERLDLSQYKGGLLKAEHPVDLKASDIKAGESDQPFIDLSDAKDKEKK
jgi:hypothetical protein